MDENDTQQSHIDFHANFDSLKALKKKSLKSNDHFSSALHSLASLAKLIWHWVGLAGRTLENQS